MGKPSPGVPLHVIDHDGNECAQDVEGDIALQVDLSESSSYFGMFDGYLGENGELDRRLRPSGCKGGQPWYLTGDRATRDKDGYVYRRSKSLSNFVILLWPLAILPDHDLPYESEMPFLPLRRLLTLAFFEYRFLWFVGRSDDVINSAGYRIGPFEVESTLKQHPAVVESAVVSSPDQSRGEVVKAFIVLTKEAAKGDQEKLVKEVQDFCKENAAPYKYPRKVQFVPPDFLPKTISGKIQRKKLKEMEWSSEPAEKISKL